MNLKGVLILMVIFGLFYFITAFFLDRRNENKTTIPVEEKEVSETDNYDDEKNIVSNLYKNVRMLYDVVNNKYKVSQEDTITIGDVIYKKILNFDEVTNSVFTEAGRKKYVEDLGSYFAYTEDGYYLAGNLVTYQTYYFRGDNTNIFITNAKDDEIDGIIYERWTSNNRNTLATIKVVYSDSKWLIDRIDILASE